MKSFLFTALVVFVVTGPAMADVTVTTNTLPPSNEVLTYFSVGYDNFAWSVQWIPDSGSFPTETCQSFLVDNTCDWIVDKITVKVREFGTSVAGQDFTLQIWTVSDPSDYIGDDLVSSHSGTFPASGLAAGYWTFGLNDITLLKGQHYAFVLGFDSGPAPGRFIRLVNAYSANDLYPNGRMFLRTGTPPTWSLTGNSSNRDFDFYIQGMAYEYERPIVSNVVVTPNPVAVGETIALTANVDDSTTGGSRIAGAAYDAGAGPVAMDPQDGAFNEVTENVEASLAAPTEPGIYGIAVTGMDILGNVGDPVVSMLIVYDPSGGFVTGGGWIDSPVNADYPYMQVGGKANFGFVAKYRKGANVPEGNTEFQFKAGDLNFHSTDYQWLVVTGSNYAKFKGTGTINGSGQYNFQIWARDDAPDTFRIKIWEGDDDVVYDNGMEQEIGGGSILVHTSNQ